MWLQRSSLPVHHRVGCMQAHPTHHGGQQGVGWSAANGPLAELNGVPVSEVGRRLDGLHSNEDAGRHSTVGGFLQGRWIAWWTACC